MTKKVVVAGFHSGGGNALLPVVQVLNQEERVEVVPILVGPAADIFQKARVPYAVPDEYEFGQIGLETGEAIIQDESPDLVLLGTSSQDGRTPMTLEQAITLAARKQHIPSPAVMDMWGTEDRKFSDYPEFTNRLYLPDKVLVQDMIAFEHMVKRDYPRDRIVVTGNPYYDMYADFKGKSKESYEKVKRQLGLKSGFTLLYTGTPTESDYGNALGYTEKDTLRALLSSVQALSRAGDDIQCIIRPHPREEVQDVISIMAEYEVRMVLDEKLSIPDAILSSDVVVSTFSSLLIDGVMLGVPGISLQPNLSVDDPMLTNSLGITTLVTSEKGMLEELDRIVHDNVFYGSLLEQGKILRPDGLARYRVRDVIYDMLDISS